MIEKDDNKLIGEAVDEELLRRFFAHSSCMQVPDDGFSRRVMQRLPGRARSRLNVAYSLWTGLCIAACVVMFFVFDGILLFTHGLQSAFGSIAATLSRYVAGFNFAQLLQSVHFTNVSWTTPLLVVAMLSVLSCIGLYAVAESD